MLFAAALVAVEGWAVSAADPDFVMPDPFHGLAIGMVALFALSALLRRGIARYTLRTIAIVAPAVILFNEWSVASREAGENARRYAVTQDRLLRYTYMPGAEIVGRPGVPSMNVLPDGLLDLPRSIPKPADVDRVVVLGDSVPNDGSIPFEQRFPHRLEQLLNASAPAGRRAEAVNVSCEGYNTLQEVRLFEAVGRKYEPTVVVVAYVLNDPFLQNGAFRRFGNSFSFFKLRAALSMMRPGGACEQFRALHDAYGFELVVRAPLERLKLLADRDGFRVILAPLPLVAQFDDPVCMGLYDRVIRIGAELGFATTRVVDSFQGEDYRTYLKPNDRFDVTHPVAAGHEKIAGHLARAVAPVLWPAPADGTP